MSKPTGQQIHDAQATLLRRAERMALRARRARVGSNERAKCIFQARLLSDCAHEIGDDKKLSAHLIKTDATEGGWRSLADSVITFIRKREKAKAHA